MATSTGADTALINHYLQKVPLSTVTLNEGRHSAKEETMISLLGSPLKPLTTTDQPSHVSPQVKPLLTTETLSKHITVKGIKPAVESLRNALNNAFAAETAAGRDFPSVLSTAGMISVRLRKPTSGAASTKISNHAWGTAIDFKLVGIPEPGNTGGTIPEFIRVLLPFMHAEGWFSGIGFKDTMHFEVAEETIKAWATQGKLKP